MVFVLTSLSTHCVSRMFLFLLFLSLPRLPWDSAVTCLVLGPLRPPGMFIFPFLDYSFSECSFSDCSFSDHCEGIPLPPFTDEQILNPPPRSHFRQSPPPQSPGFIGGCCPTGSPTAVVWSYGAGWSTLTWLVTGSFIVLFIQLSVRQLNAGC